MIDPIVWLIIAAFYAPLHYVLPIVFLFITGKEDDATRTRLIKGTFVDSTISMIVAFGLIIWLARNHLYAALILLGISIFSPFVRIWFHRREIEGRG